MLNLVSPMRILYISLIFSLFSLPLLVAASDMVPDNASKQTDEGIIQVLITGKDQPVVVEKGETLILKAGEKIVFKPGTKILAGGSLHASIVKNDIRALKKKEKEQPLEITQTEQEKIEEHNSLEVAATLISPFVTRAPVAYRNMEKDAEQLSIQSTSTPGILVEPQRRMATNPVKHYTTYNLQPKTSCTSTYASPATKGQAFRVLRL